MLYYCYYLMIFCFIIAFLILKQADKQQEAGEVKFCRNHP